MKKDNNTINSFIILTGGKMRNLIFGVFTVLSLSCLISAAGGDGESAVYVSPRGNDFNIGTLESPVMTISRGLDIAYRRGAVEVLVACGVYVESGINLYNGISLRGGYRDNFSGRNLDLEGDATVIRGPELPVQDNGNRIISAVYITENTLVEGFVITNGQTIGEGAGMLVSNCGPGLEIRNNMITGNRAIYFGSMGGNLAVINSASIIKDNIITEGFTGGGLDCGMDMYIEGSYEDETKPVVVNNVFTMPSYVLNAAGVCLRKNFYLERGGEVCDGFVDEGNNGITGVKPITGLFGSNASAEYEVFNIKGQFLGTVDNFSSITDGTFTRGIGKFIVRFRDAGAVRTQIVTVRGR